MIFKQEYVDMIISGKKTQSRRPNRGYYKEGHSYSIQPCRTCKGIPGYRIVMDTIRDEHTDIFHEIATKDAQAEGGYTPEEFELLFRALYPKWNRVTRYVFKFHVMEEKGGLNMAAWILMSIAVLFICVGLCTMADGLYSLICFSMAAICYGFAKVVWTLEERCK